MNNKFLDLEQLKKHPNVYTEDTKPLQDDKRDWTTWSVASLWIGIMVSIPVYMLAGGLIASGMSWIQAIFTIVLGHTIVMIPAVLLGHFGTKYSVGFPLLSKLVFGPKGNLFPTLIRALLGCFWFGVQSWIGGTAINSIVINIIPTLKGNFTIQFISYLIFLIINVYIALNGAKALKIFEQFSAPLLIALSLSVLIWAYRVAGGFGRIFSYSELNNSNNFLQIFFPALTAMIAFDSTIAINISDYTKNVRKQSQQAIGQFLGAPIMTAFIVFVGVCGTIGAQIKFGEMIWNPADLVAKFDNPVIVIIFSIFIIIATMTTNIPANLIPPGIIFSNIWTKLFTYKKAILLVLGISIIVMPWKVLENPNNYIFEVNGTLATFLGPMTGIYLSSYWYQYKTNIYLFDLYLTDGGKYFYYNGWNIYAMIILFVSTIIVLIGKFTDLQALKFLYESSYVFGLLISFILYAITIKINNSKRS